MSNKAAYKDLFNLVCDERIGYGLSRTVYSSKLLPEYVVKVEVGAQRHDNHLLWQNVNEWEVWKYAVDLPASRWFARCAWISGEGRILVMEKTRPAAQHEYPNALPAYLCDLKPSNFGMVTAREGDKSKDYFVAHDYGVLHHAVLNGLRSKRMVKMKWEWET